MMPRWLTEHLAKAGALNVDGITREARVRRCQDCPSWTVVGLDADRCAGPATADAEPLSRVGEALALLAGRQTYTLRRIGTRLELDHRHRWAVGGSRPGDGPYDVVAAHRCHAPPLPTIDSLIRPRTQEVAAHGPAPF